MTARRNSLLICATLIFANTNAFASDRSELPSFAQVESAAAKNFASAELGPRDLISRENATQLIEQLIELGWDVPNADKLIELTLPSSHTLVRTLRKKQGKRFMNKVSGYKLIYDRLDRVSQVSGGQQLLQSIMKLPNGERYARIQTPGGVPDLVALLPKTRNGKKRSIPQYQQPTGNIYTPVDLVTWLRESYDTGPAN